MTGSTGRENEEREPFADVLDVVVVRVGGVEVGLPVEQIIEVGHVPEITRIPFPPPSVLGVVSIRNSVLPVVDVGDRLFGRPARRDGFLVVAAVGPEAERVALLVDETRGLVPLGAAVAEPPAEVTESLPDGWIATVLAPSESRLVTVLDLDEVLAGESPHQKGR